MCFLVSFSAVSSAVASVSPIKTAEHIPDVSSFEPIVLISLAKYYFSQQPLFPKEIYDALSEAVGMTLVNTCVHVFHVNYSVILTLILCRYKCGKFPYKCGSFIAA